MRHGQGLTAKLQGLNQSRLQILVCDVADVAETSTMVRAVTMCPGTSTSFVHGAGIGDKGLLSDLSMSRVSLVLAPKAAGAYNANAPWTPSGGRGAAASHA